MVSARLCLPYYGLGMRGVVMVGALPRDDKMAFRDRNSSSGSDGVYGVENEGEDNFEDEPDLEEEEEIELSLSAPPDGS